MRLALLAVLAVALALRLGLALSAPVKPIGGDPRVYDAVGVALAAGHGWSRHGAPTALHPPAWPLVLGAADAVTDHEDRQDLASASGPVAGGRALAAARARWRAGRVVNALLGTLAVWLIALIAGELWGRRAAVTAGAVAAVYPALAVLGVALLSEPLFVAAELGAVYAVLRARRAGWGWIVLAGALCGLAVLTRANGAVLLLPLALGVRSPRRIAVLLAAAALTVAPWTWRNVQVFHAPVPVATDLGQTLAGTYDPLAAADRFRWRATRRLPAVDRPALRQPTEAKRSSALTREALHYIGAHPGDVVLATAWNTARLAELDQHGLLAGELGSRTLAAIGILGFAVLVPLAVAGAFTRRARAAPLWLWLIPLLLWASTAPFAVNFSRFRAPIDPFLELLAAAAVLAAGAAMARSSAAPRATPRRSRRWGPASRRAATASRPSPPSARWGSPSA